MKTLTRLEARGAQQLLMAIPFKAGSAALSGKTMAAIAITIAALRKVEDELTQAAKELADKIKPEGYDENVRKREEAIKALFPEEKDIDPEVWKQKCPDPEFEKVFIETEDTFRKAYLEAANEKVDVPVRLTEEHLADIAGVVVELEDVELNGSQLPVGEFLNILAQLLG